MMFARCIPHRRRFGRIALGALTMAATLSASSWASACQPGANVALTADLISNAIGVIKAKITDIDNGPSLPRATNRRCARSLVLTLKTHETYKGSIYDEWRVLWRCGNRHAYPVEPNYIAVIHRIGQDLRGDPKYDLFGELPRFGHCHPSKTLLFPSTPQLEAAARGWGHP